MSKFLWGEICETTYIINRSPHRALGGKSPYSKLYSRNPDLSSLRIIGARAFVHKETHVHKLEQKAWEGLMIEYGKDSSSYRIYNPQTRRITESRDVTFIETLPKALSPAGQEKLLETNEEEAYHLDILGHLPLPSSQDEDQDATKASLAPSASSEKKEGTVGIGSAPRSRDPFQRAHPVQRGHHPTRPAARPYQLGHPLRKRQRYNQLLH